MFGTFAKSEYAPRTFFYVNFGRVGSLIGKPPDFLQRIGRVGSLIGKPLSLLLIIIFCGHFRRVGSHWQPPFLSSDYFY